MKGYRILRAGLGCGLASVALGAAGCSDDTTTTATATATSDTVTVDAGCNERQPRRIDPPRAEWGPIVQICIAPEGSTLQLHNVSTSTVLRVTPANTSTEARQAGSDAGEVTSVADGAAATVAPASCNQSWCSLPPAATVLATGSPAHVALANDPRATLSVVLARSLGSWAQGRVTPRSLRIAGSIKTCVTAATASADATRPDDALRAVAGDASCGALIDQVMRDSGDDQRPTESTFAEIARRLDNGAWRDELTALGARIVARR